MISKIGKVTQKDRSKLIGLMARDLLEEFEKDAEGWASYKALQKEDQKTVTKRLSSSVTAEVTNYFVDVQVDILIILNLSGHFANCLTGRQGVTTYLFSFKYQHIFRISSGSVGRGLMFVS